MSYFIQTQRLVVRGYHTTLHLCKACICQLHSSGFKMHTWKPQCLLCGGLTDQSSGQVKQRDAVSVALGKIRKTSYDCPITFKVLRNTEEVVISV